MRRFFPWPGLIFVFIGTTVIVQGATLIYALGDEGFAAVADYDAKSQAWDEHSAELRASEALGWSVQAVPSPQGEQATVLTLRLDGTSAPVQGSFEAFHNATPQQRHVGSVRVRDDGLLELPIAEQRPGWWQLELELRQGADRFLHRDKLWLPVGTEPAPVEPAS